MTVPPEAPNCWRPLAPEAPTQGPAAFQSAHGSNTRLPAILGVINDRPCRRSTRLARESKGTPQRVNIYGYLYNIDTNEMSLIVEDKGLTAA